MAVADSGQEPLRLQATLDAELARAELDMYLSTAGMVDRAEDLEARAAAADLVSRVRRARLLRADVLSRRGELEEALRIQVETLTEAELDADRMVCARAHCALASTYDRLTEPGKALLSAEESVRLLAPGDPRHWPAEHMMILALFTSYWRLGSVDYTTFDEALRLARDLGDPLMLLAVLNNYIYVGLTRGDRQVLAMVEEMRRLVERELADSCPSAWLDTIAVGLMEVGKLEEAAEIARAAVEAAPKDLVEPTATSMCILTQAQIERARGNLRLAAQRAEAAATLAREAGVGEAIARALSELSELAALEGDYRSAYELLRERNEAMENYLIERNELHAATLQAIYAVEVERQQRLALEALADSDPLTGLYNRRYMNRQLTGLVQGPVALALVDIDHFKQINDRFSHDAGDRVLCHLATMLRAHVEELGCPDGFVARIGGEEFVLAMPGVDEDEAFDCCERLRTAVEARSLDEIVPDLRITVSIGLAVQNDEAGDASALLGRADTQLYNAKRQGRNRVIIELGP